MLVLVLDTAKILDGHNFFPFFIFYEEGILVVFHTIGLIPQDISDQHTYDTDKTGEGNRT